MQSHSPSRSIGIQFDLPICSSRSDRISNAEVEKVDEIGYDSMMDSILSEPVRQYFFGWGGGGGGQRGTKVANLTLVLLF